MNKQTNKKPNNNTVKLINLALQGGGAHGAFAWGVLDKLIEDGRVDIDGLSATSAGSMNAVVYAYGKMTGGPDGAREALHEFWQEISRPGNSTARSNRCRGKCGK
jgi:Predicted esterase of the alpha-beta hydrolase superfamily